MNLGGPARNKALLGALGELYSIMSAARRRQFRVLLVFMFVGAIAELAAIGTVLPFLSVLVGIRAFKGGSLTGRMFDAIGAVGSHDRLVALAGLFILVAILAAVVRLQLARLTQKFTFGLGHDLAVEIYRRLLSQHYPFHVAHGTTMAVAALDKVAGLASGVLLQRMQAVIAASLATVIFAALVWVEPLAAILCAAGLSLSYALMCMAVRRRLRGNSRLIRSAIENRVRLVQESFGAIRELITDRLQPVYVESFRRIDGELSAARADTMFIAAAPKVVIEDIGVSLIAVAAVMLSSGRMGLAPTLPVLGTLALGAQRLLPLLQQIYANWSVVTGNRSIINQVVSLARLPVGGDLVPRQPAAPRGLLRSIRFDQVRFGYPGRGSSVLDNVSFEIGRGEHVALTGSSGAGKSTIADLLLGLLEPSQGRIIIDGEALTRSNLSGWRGTIAHVSQSVFLVNDTLLRNIALGAGVGDIDLERATAAAATAQLGDFVRGLPDGFQTVVGERGIALSGGQRQRLGIARALYKHAPVLLLDEATSALDEETEAALLRALFGSAGGARTILVISHRASAVGHADRLLRLEAGRIVEIPCHPLGVPACERRANAHL